MPLAETVPPRSGWLKAIRTALGLTTRQLGARMGTTHQVPLRMERSETEGTITLDSLERAAQAMNCRLVYAIVPASEFGTLEAIVDARATELARTLASAVSHTMHLESQGVDAANTKVQIKRLAEDLKRTADRRLWEK